MNKNRIKTILETGKVWILSGLMLLSGCVQQGANSRGDLHENLFNSPAMHVAGAGNLPEEIFIYPPLNAFDGARVGVFSFAGPDYAPNAGRTASQILCNELEKARAFREVHFHPDLLDMTIGNVINIARINRYDLIITGRLLSYFEGSAVEASRIREEIQVIRVSGPRPRVIWHASAYENGSPVLSKDYIFALSEGKPAPSTTVLMRKSAEKFCRMILTVPPRKAY